MEDLDREEIRGEKVAANPIPDNSYTRFKYRLEEKSGELSQRNLTLLSLGVGTGYRLQDIIDLTVGEIKEALKYGEFSIQEKKQYKSWITHIKKNPNSKRKCPKKRKAPIKGNLRQILEAHVIGKRKSEYAFKSNNSNSHLQAKSFSFILSQVGKEIDLENISGHSLRKTYATRIYDKTGDIERVRRALGHKSIETTKVYLGLYEKAYEEDAEAVDSLL